MGKCTHCGDSCPTTIDPDKGWVCCANCGKIIEQNVYSSEPTFYKDNSGQSHFGGNILRSMETGYSASHERTLMRGRDEIRYIVNCLNIGGGDTIIDEAHRFYKIAIDKNFTRGRKTMHVAASCLYIACRRNKRPYLLIDFSDYLQINVYVLGAVFLQLCKLLHLAEHPIVQKLVDPSLFIHRFTERLLGKKNNAVSETALRILASMKRDWMVTGRKPSGLCGAALYISALSHGFDYTKSELVSVVHVCEGTLTKRLIEFENTESGSLTIDEFLVRAEELENETMESISNQQPQKGDVLCKHKDKKGVVHFAHGLCKKCYDKFVEISGGLEGGAEPPAFQKAEMERKKIEAQKAQKKNSLFDEEEEEALHMGGKETQYDAPEIAKNNGHESDEAVDEFEKEDDEPETLSDIDDAEVEEYLHNEEEKHYKKIIWEEMNKEYLEEQALKEAAKKEAEEKEPRKVRKRKNEEDTGPAKTPFEATCNILKKKRFASKVNLDAVEELYNMDDGSFDEETIEKNMPKGEGEKGKYFDEFQDFEENVENNGNKPDEFDFMDEFDFD